MAKEEVSKMNKESISLRDYFDQQFKALREYMDVRFDSIEKSTCLAQENLNTRLEGMNEFRTAMKDQAGTFITRIECDTNKERYISEIQTLRETNATAEGKASQRSVTVAYVIAAIGIIISIVNAIIYLFSHR